MNIDVILDSFWQEYCNLYPVDLNNHARYFDWFLLKNYLNDEVEYHYPSDIIQVDLSDIGEGVFEFFMEDYVSSCEEYYQICKMSGVKQVSPVPKIFLEDAFCDIKKKGNTYKYKLLINPDDEGAVPTPSATPSTTPSATTVPESSPKTPESSPESTAGVPAGVPAGEIPTATPAQVQVEIEKERLRKEYELKQQKLQQLASLLKEGVITFEQYMDAVKQL
jgi:hypothetical protein